MRICDTCRLQTNCSQESDSGYCVHYEAEPPEVAFVREMVAIADADTNCEQCKYHYHKDGYGLCVVHEACDDVAMAWEAWQAAQKEPADACGVTATPPPLGSLAALVDDSEGLVL